MWDVFAVWVTSQEGSYVLSGLIAAVGVSQIWRLFARAHKCVKLLKRVSGRLEEYESPADFGSRFDEADIWLGEDPVVAEPWALLKDLLILPDANSKPMIVRKSPGSEMVMDLDRLVAPYFHISFFEAVPSYLTGLGLLGTFLGLVAGIYLAKVGLASNDPTSMRESLGSLLGGADAAFLTSVVGLALSIPFSLLLKGRLRVLDRVVERVRSRFHQLIPSVTPERLIQDSIFELTRQSVQLERFNNDFAVAVASALDDRMSDRLVPALSKVVDAIESLRIDRSSTNEEILRQMVEDFRKMLSGAADSGMKDLAQTLKSLTESLGNVISLMNDSRAGLLDGLEGGLVAFQQGVEDIAKQLKEAVGLMQAQMAESAKIQSEFIASSVQNLHGGIVMTAEALDRSRQGLISGLEEGGKAVQGYFAALDQPVGQLAVTVERANSVVARAAEAGNAWRNASLDSARRISDAVGSLTKGSEVVVGVMADAAKLQSQQVAATRSLDSGVATVQSAVMGLERTMKVLQSHSEQITKVWASQEARFVGLDQEIGKTFDAIDTGVNAYTKQVWTFVKEIEKAFSVAVQSLAGAISELSETADEIATASTKR